MITYRLKAFLTCKPFFYLHGKMSTRAHNIWSFHLDIIRLCLKDWKYCKPAEVQEVHTPGGILSVVFYGCIFINVFYTKWQK